MHLSISYARDQPTMALAPMKDQIGAPIALAKDLGKCRKHPPLSNQKIPLLIYHSLLL